MFKNNKLIKIATLLFLVIAIILCSGITYKIVKYKAYIWLPGYCRDVILNYFNKADKINPNSEKHVLFVFCDHFEPGIWSCGIEEQNKRIDFWVQNYKKLAERHYDSDGFHPRHSWFYAVHERNPYVMRRLNELVSAGLGEIEFHLHHGNENADNFERSLKENLNWFNQFGAMITSEPKPRMYFGFIHGMFTLDNSAYGKRPGDYCGVNNELELLAKYGCYADFTFSALGTDAQPKKTNSIFYAADSSSPKSYNSGSEMRVGREGKGDILLIEGPTAITLSKYLFEMGCLDLPPTKARVDSWVKANVHVKGRPEWIFVKVYIHSAYVSRDLMFGKAMDNMFSYLEAKYNRFPYRLHYVTAREAYNIAKAAEAGLSGDPNNYRDFLIKPPLNRKNKIVITQVKEQ